jgi:hypothetical protein
MRAISSSGTIRFAREASAAGRDHDELTRSTFDAHSLAAHDAME